MDLNVIKKELYKAKPIARLSFTADKYVQYIAHLGNIDVVFEVPKAEHEFSEEVPAQLLIRWIKN